MQPMTFPLFERAVERGVLEGRSALIVAPTATGKSFIGREVVRSSLEKGRPGPHAYLVPFRSLAGEVYDHFHDLLGPTDYRLRISTGDYREPIRPEVAFEVPLGHTRVHGRIDLMPRANGGDRRVELIDVKTSEKPAALRDSHQSAPALRRGLGAAGARAREARNS